jgi:phytoene desaturase
VYLTGGGTHPGSGLPVIYESARITSRLLLQDWDLPHEHCLAAVSSQLSAVSQRQTREREVLAGS